MQYIESSCAQQVVWVAIAGVSLLGLQLLRTGHSRHEQGRSPDVAGANHPEVLAAKIGGPEAVQDVHLHCHVCPVLDAGPPPHIHGHLVHLRVLFWLVGPRVQLRPPAGLL